MSKLGSTSKSSSAKEADFLDLCKLNVQSICVLTGGGSLLNRRQCQDLSSKLSRTTLNFEELIIYCGASVTLFRPALENLCRYLEKAKALVSSCAEEDWCAAAVFQYQNENAFGDILLDVGLCYHAIYEQAKSRRKEWNHPPEDLRESPILEPAPDSDVDGDKQDLQETLDELANGYSNVKFSDKIIPGKVARKRSLANQLLLKMYCTSTKPQADTLETYSAMLWRKGSEPPGTWGNSRFLGAGSGASGVCSTSWLGIPCAKKEFHGHESESSFLKEAGILAHLKHPCIVNFMCCGNGSKRGDRFIAMELMEMSLYDLIEEQRQKGEHFPVGVAVDMIVQMARGMWYLHGEGVAHRDLKPQNVVVNRLSIPQQVDHYCVKLVDFGVSKSKVEVAKSNTMTARGIGTAMYRAPEVHPKANPGGMGRVNWVKADAFSFAMTCAHLLSLEAPFKKVNVGELYNELTKNGRRPEVPEMYPEDLVVLLKDCWKTSPCSRPSFKEICVRLEVCRQKLLRSYSTLDKGLDENELDFNDDIDFIRIKVESYMKNRPNDGVEGEIVNDVIAIIPCACGCALELLPQPPSSYTWCYCNMCWKDTDGEIYHCEACQFDAHPHCAEIKDKVEVFFHDHILHLLVWNYYHNKPDVICYLCEESVQHSEWVYRCEQCDFDVHALCTKFPRERMWASVHSHLLIMRRVPPHKYLSCICCKGELKHYSWYYTCQLQSCAFDLHPLCTNVSWDPLCIFDISHRIHLMMDQRTFYCSRCGALGFSWSYYCKHCDVDIHPDCVYAMDEERSLWYGAYEKFMVENGNVDKITKISMISELVNKVPLKDGLEISSSSRSRQPLVSLRVQPAIQRLVLTETSNSLDASKDMDLQSQIAAETAERLKAKKMAAKEVSQKLSSDLHKMLKNLAEILVDLRSSETSMSGDKVQKIAATDEKLKRRQQLVKEQMAMQVQSKMSPGPRFAVFYQGRMENGKWVRELLTSLRADMKDVCFALLCEVPGHEHIVPYSTRRYTSELGEERPEKLQPLLACGLQVVMRFLNTLDPLELVKCGLKSITVPCLQAEFPWNLRAIEMHGNGSIHLLEDKEKVEALKRADSAAEWFRNYQEIRGCGMLKIHGLQRVRYKEGGEDEFWKRTRGNVAWVCREHVNSGLKDGTLEPYPLKYHNVEDDYQLRFPHVSPLE